jgi:5,10-methylenetetrahydrofolate reductase
MEKFIRLLNIERFRRLLSMSPAESEREILERLLAEEEEKEEEEKEEEEKNVDPEEQDRK